MIQFFSIGVYNTSEEVFFEKLIRHKIDVFCDIRRIRLVRGSKYSFVNKNKLITKLQQLGINYIHIPELAPSDEIRNVQKEFDKRNKVIKRQRHELSEEFISLYRKNILNPFNFNDLFENFNKIKAKNVVFFCVEQEHNACHRSLVAKKLFEEFNYQTIHL
ncbi:MAG: hypothetical protein OHK0036_18990 [Bacteroidia bacterium]